MPQVKLRIEPVKTALQIFWTKQKLVWKRCWFVIV